MPLSISYDCWLSLTVTQVPYCCYKFLTVFSSSMHVFPFLLWLLIVSHFLSGHMELLRVPNCLLWLLAASQSLSLCHGVAACISMST